MSLTRWLVQKVFLKERLTSVDGDEHVAEIQPTLVKIKPWAYAWAHAFLCYLTLSDFGGWLTFCSPLMSADGTRVTPFSHIVVDDVPAHANSRAPCNCMYRTDVGTTECSGRRGLGGRKPSAPVASLAQNRKRVYDLIDPRSISL